MLYVVDIQSVKRWHPSEDGALVEFVSLHYAAETGSSLWPAMNVDSSPENFWRKAADWLNSKCQTKVVRNGKIEFIYSNILSITHC